MNSQKNERFKRIASSRTSKILEQIRLLSNCSNKNNYSYSDEEVKRIFSVIETELKVAKAKFQPMREREKFSL